MWERAACEGVKAPPPVHAATSRGFAPSSRAPQPPDRCWAKQEMTPLPSFLFRPGNGGCLLEVPRHPRPPIRTLLCLLAHFLPCLQSQRLPGGEEGTDLGALHADDRVKEALRPPGTSYLPRVFNPLELPPPPPHLRLSREPVGSLQSSHYATSGIVLSCSPP